MLYVFPLDIMLLHCSNYTKLFKFLVCNILQFMDNYSNFHFEIFFLVTAKTKTTEIKVFEVSRRFYLHTLMCKIV